MEGTAYVDSYQDFDSDRQTFPLFPEPVSGVLSRSLLEFQLAFAKWKEGNNYAFSQLTEDQLKDIRGSTEAYRVLAQRYGVSKSTIQRARAGMEAKKKGRPVKGGKVCPRGKESESRG